MLSGVLYKKGEVNKAWKRRYCELYASHYLQYYKVCRGHREGASPRETERESRSSTFTRHVCVCVCDAEREEGRAQGVD